MQLVTDKMHFQFNVGVNAISKTQLCKLYNTFQLLLAGVTFFTNLPPLFYLQKLWGKGTSYIILAETKNHNFGPMKL